MNEEKPKPWNEALVVNLGAKLKKLRGPQSAQWLSDRTAELGYRVPASAIAKLDSGHRKGVLQVSELLVLAAALEIPPIMLLYPDLLDGDVEVLPGVKWRSSEAADWFTGHRPYGGSTSTQRVMDMDGLRKFLLLRAEVRHATLLEDSAYATKDSEHLNEVRDKLNGLRDLWRDKGYTVDD